MVPFCANAALHFGGAAPVLERSHPPPSGEVKAEDATEVLLYSKSNFCSKFLYGNKRHHSDYHYAPPPAAGPQTCALAKLT